MSGKKEAESKGFLGSSGLIAVGIFFSRILGLAREQVVAYYFGASAATDAYQIAFRIPNLLRDLFAEGAMSSALVPVYTKVRHQEGEALGWDLVRNLINTLAIVLSILTFVGILFSSKLVSIYAPAFQAQPEKFALTVSLTQILWPFLPLVVMAAVWMGVLNARDCYGVPSFASSLFNVMSILFVLVLSPLMPRLFNLHPIYGLAIGSTVGAMAQWAVQMPSLYREGFRYRLMLNWRDPFIRKIVMLMGAGTFGLAATQINVFVNSVLASSQGDGAVSWLNYAFRLMQFPIGVFGVAISTATLTKVSREIAATNLKAVRESLEQSLRLVMVLTIPSAVGLAVMGIPIIGVIYQRGHFTLEDTYATSVALAGYSLGLTAYSAIKVMVPILYSLGKPRSAILSSGLSVALNVCMSLVFVRLWGYAGLSLALSISSLLNVAILLWLMERHIAQINFYSLLNCLIRVLLAAAVMAIIVYIALYFVDLRPFQPISLTSRWVRASFLMHLIFLMVVLAVAIAVFFATCKVLGLQEVDRLVEIIWKRLKIRRA